MQFWAQFLYNEFYELLYVSLCDSKFDAFDIVCNVSTEFSHFQEALLILILRQNIELAVVLSAWYLNNIYHETYVKITNTVHVNINIKQNKNKLFITNKVK